MHNKKKSYTIVKRCWKREKVVVAVAMVDRHIKKEVKCKFGVVSGRIKHCDGHNQVRGECAGVAMKLNYFAFTFLPLKPTNLQSKQSKKPFPSQLHDVMLCSHCHRHLSLFLVICAWVITVSSNHQAVFHCPFQRKEWKRTTISLLLVPQSSFCSLHLVSTTTPTFWKSSRRTQHSHKTLH